MLTDGMMSFGFKETRNRGLKQLLLASWYGMIGVTVMGDFKVLSACHAQSLMMWGLKSFKKPNPPKLSSPVSCFNFASEMMFFLLEGSCTTTVRYVECRCNGLLSLQHACL